MGNFKLLCLLQSGAENIIVLEANILGAILTMEDKTVKIHNGLYQNVSNHLEANKKKILKDLGE